MKRHQRRTTRGPVSNVALRGQFTGLAPDTAMLALLTNASVFCEPSRGVECRLMNEVEVRQGHETHLVALGGALTVDDIRPDEHR